MRISIPNIQRMEGEVIGENGELQFIFENDKNEWISIVYYPEKHSVYIVTDDFLVEIFAMHIRFGENAVLISDDAILFPNTNAWSEIQNAFEKIKEYKR